MDLSTEPEEAKNLALLIEEEEAAEATGSARPLVLTDPKKKEYLDKLRPRVAEAMQKSRPRHLGKRRAVTLRNANKSAAG